MSKWIIDRTINLDEFKTREVLKALLIEPRKTDGDLEILLHDKGVLKNQGDGALRRRWFTYLRNYGLLKGEDVTEVGKLYSECKLTLSELALLQLIKKKITLSSGTEIFPLKVLVSIFKKLSLIDKDEGYLSAEEFSSIVVNVLSDNNTDIDKIVKEILDKRHGGILVPLTEGQHQDIWFNCLKQTNLFEYFGRSLYVKDFEMLDILYDFYNTKTKDSYEYGDFEFEFTNNLSLPAKGTTPQDLDELLKVKNISNILYDFFFKDFSVRKLEEKYYSNRKKYVGIIADLKLANIDKSSISLYKKYKSYPNFVLLNMLKSSDNELREVAKIMQTVTLENEDMIDKPVSCDKADGGFNKIYYGAPGCGKSHFVQYDILDACNVPEENRFRTTFHPEYANSDFVGQIMPSIEKVVDSTDHTKFKDEVKYKFVPGPFIAAVLRALETNDMVYLVIEEINRGNASAIFGDTFQLLDRIKSDKPNFGESEYPIYNENVEKYIKDELEKDGINININHLVIPSNLTILATMNSSDQNVFTLDTAFKRRWMFEQISNDITKDKNHSYKSWKIPGTKISWETFVTKVNDEILRIKIDSATNEDKRLGKYFVTKDCLTEKEEKLEDVQDEANNFAYKVLEYLWNDVAKYTPEVWFDISKYKTLEQLIDGFKVEGLAIFPNINFNE